jgi:hypothetical protein
VPGPSASWRLFFQDVRKKKAVKAGCTPATQYDKRNEDTARRLQHQDHRAVPRVSQEQPMLHPRPLSRKAIASVLLLESEILGGQTKLGAAEDRRGLLGVVAHVRPHGMDIAPGPLDGIVEKDDPTAAGL